MENQFDSIIEVLNSTPKANLNYAKEIYSRYTEEFDDGIYVTNKQTGKKDFLLKQALEKLLTKEIIDEIGNGYFDALEKFFQQNYMQDTEYILGKYALFLKMMKSKTEKYFNIKDGDFVIKKGVYKDLFGIQGTFELSEEKTKKQFMFELINLSISEFIKQVIGLRLFVIYTILLVLEKNQYRSDLTDKEIFDAVNEDIIKIFFKIDEKQ